MKKKIIIVCAILAVIAGSVYLIVFLLKNGEQSPKTVLGANDKDWSKGEYETYQITQKNPTEIIWLGDWCGEENISSETVRFANELTNETLKRNPQYQRVAIAINEMTSDLDIDESQYEMLFQYVNNNPNYYFMYFGEKDLPLLAEISESTSFLRDMDRSIGFYYSRGMIVPQIGFYTLEEIKYDINIYDTFVDWLSWVYDYGENE